MKTRFSLFAWILILILAVTLFAACTTTAAKPTPENDAVPVAGKYSIDSGYWLDSSFYVMKQTMEFFLDGTATMFVSGLSVSTGDTINHTYNGTYIWKNGELITCKWQGAETSVEYLYTGTAINTGYAILHCVGRNSKDEFAGMYHMVSYGISGPGDIEGDAIQYVRNGENTTSVTAVPSLGAEFVKWSDGLTSPTRSETDVKNSKRVFAVFKQVSEVYSIQYATADGNGIIQGASYQSVLAGEKGTEVKAVPDRGYRFVKWSDGKTDNPRTDTIDPQNPQNIVVKAIFEAGYLLTYSAAEGGRIDGKTTQRVVYWGNGTTVTAIPDEGYIFVEWSDGIGTPSRTDVKVTGDLSVYAIFMPAPTLENFTNAGSSLQNIVSFAKTGYKLL